MRRRLLVGGLAAALAGCKPSLLDYESRVHVVRPGETLYTIAWRYGLDYRDLARWNGISDPDFIRVGQQIALRAGVTTPAEPPPQRRPRPERSAPRPLPAPVELPAPAWAWPTDGRVVSNFGGSGGIASGIAIAGAAGQPIVAAAAGRIVYVGTGLAGYGQLVIVRHNDTYLSAYGHTDAPSVAQGQDVQRGQRIAAMGLGPQRQPRLHFEIRRNGTPVDPLTLLPTRRP